MPQLKKLCVNVISCDPYILAQTCKFFLQCDDAPFQIHLTSVCIRYTSGGTRKLSFQRRDLIVHIVLKHPCTFTQKNAVLVILSQNLQPILITARKNKSKYPCQTISTLQRIVALSRVVPNQYRARNTTVVHSRSSAVMNTFQRMTANQPQTLLEVQRFSGSDNTCGRRARGRDKYTQSMQTRVQNPITSQEQCTCTPCSKQTYVIYEPRSRLVISSTSGMSLEK